MVSKNRKKSWKRLKTVKEIDDHIVRVNVDYKYGGSVQSQSADDLWSISTNSLQNKEMISPNKNFKCWNHLRSNTFSKPILTPKLINSNNLPVRYENKYLRKRHTTSTNYTLLTSDNGIFAKPLWIQPYNKENNVCDTVKAHINRDSINPPRHGCHTHYAHNTQLLNNNKLPAVLLPHPGTSYNPTTESCKDLENIVQQKEMKRQKEEVKLNRHLAQLQISKTQLKRMRRNEMKLDQDLSCSFEATQSTTEDIPTNPPVKIKRKSKRQKLAYLRYRQEKLEKRKIKLLKKQNNDIDHINKLIDSYYNPSSHSKKPRSNHNSSSVLMSQRLMKFHDEELTKLKFRSEIKPELSNITPERNLIIDRYKSLKRRSIVSKRRKIAILRKTTVRYFEKKSFKEIT